MFRYFHVASLCVCSKSFFTLRVGKLLFFEQLRHHCRWLSIAGNWLHMILELCISLLQPLMIFFSSFFWFSWSFAVWIWWVSALERLKPLMSLEKVNKEKKVPKNLTVQVDSSCFVIEKEKAWKSNLVSTHWAQLRLNWFLLRWAGVRIPQNKRPTKNNTFGGRRVIKGERDLPPYRGGAAAGGKPIGQFTEEISHHILPKKKKNSTLFYKHRNS